MVFFDVQKFPILINSNLAFFFLLLFVLLGHTIAKFKVMKINPYVVFLAVYGFSSQIGHSFILS